MSDLRERFLGKSNPVDDAAAELIGRFAPIATIDDIAFYRPFYLRREDIGKFEIEKVVFNDPATIIIWKGGGKTVVRCQAGDTYDPEKGLALCFMKRALDNAGNYNNIFRKWLPEKGEQE